VYVDIHCVGLHEDMVYVDIHCVGHAIGSVRNSCTKVTRSQGKDLEKEKETCPDS
jgi:hypothetical protein